MHEKPTQQQQQFEDDERDDCFSGLLSPPFNSEEEKYDDDGNGTLELEEFEQISPSVKSAVLRKFDETITDKLENEVDTSLLLKADRLWSFR